MSERPGLYIMVFVTMVASCEAADKSNKAEKALEQIAKTVNPPAKTAD
jgi:hypothetical protein